MIIDGLIINDLFLSFSNKIIDLSVVEGVEPHDERHYKYYMK